VEPSPAAPEPSPAPPDHAWLWEEELRQRVPRLAVTWVLIALNVAVAVAMLVGGVSPLSPQVADLIKWGADYGPRTAAGEWWRLGSSMFVHIGLLHIALNMFALRSVGRLAERIFGHGLYLGIYVAAGLWGAVASLLWHPDLVSAGASGAIFGIYGAVFGFLVRHRGSIPAAVLNKQRSAAVMFLVNNLIVGASLNVDMAAHLGGLGAGLLAGYLLGRPLDQRQPPRRLWLAAWAFAALAPLVAKATVKPMPDFLAELDAFTKTEATVIATYNKAVERSRAGQMNDADLGRVVDTEVLPPWRTNVARLHALVGLPKKQQTLIDRVTRYADERLAAWDSFSRALRTNDAAALEAFKKHNAAADELLRQTNEK
jgi:rhomboid protease GluP